MPASIPVQWWAIRRAAPHRNQSLFMAPHHHILPVEPMALLDHVFTHRGHGTTVFLELFHQGSLGLPDVGCRTVGTFDGVHQTCLFFHREPVCRSYQTGSDHVVGAAVSHHASTVEKVSLIIWSETWPTYGMTTLPLLADPDDTGVKSMSLGGIQLPPSRPSWCILRHLALSSNAVSPGSGTPCPCK